VEADQLLAGTLLAGFMEELVYRAFVFGMLFLQARLGFVPAVLFNAIPFSLGHLRPEIGFAGIIPVLLLTCAAGGFFAWLYVEWERNIWLPVALHALMNLSWSLFDMGGNAAGGAVPNLLRVGTIALAIALTLRYKQRFQQGMGVNRKNLLTYKESASGAVT
jgi:membrane protease YdiL (CAAX protease family)